MEANSNIPYPSPCGKSRIQSDLDLITWDLGQDDLGDRIMSRGAMAKTRPISVAVVGAGFAGLRCADVQLQRGVKVTIFEARNRLGGRVGQSKQLGHQVDLGPNWIHGTNDNPILNIARSTKTELHGMEESQYMIDTSGQPLDPDEANEFAELYWDAGVIAEAFKHSNDYCESIPASRSLYDFFEERSKTLFNTLPSPEAEKKRERFLQCANMWGSYIGSPVQRQSLKYFWLEECIEGENPFVAGTYEKILDVVARPAREKAEIRLEAKVVGIHTGDCISTPDAQTIVETADGFKESFDEVVVTVPLGYLKRNQHIFTPPLPPRLAQAIANISYGTLDKVYITFPSAFWDEPLSAASPTSKSKPLDSSQTTPNVKAPAQPIPQSSTTSSYHDDSHHPAFTHWLPPSYTPETNPGCWDQQAMSLSCLPSPTAHPTLLFYIYGPCAAHIANLTTTLSPQDLTPALLAFFHPYISRLPNYSPTDPQHQPTAALATAWAADEFAGYGSYSNFQVGLEAGDRDIETMRHGCPERGLWFAGEHTAPFVACGTSTGAYWSGEAVGQRIVRAYGLEKQTDAPE